MMLVLASSITLLLCGVPLCDGISVRLPDRIKDAVREGRDITHTLSPTEVNDFVRSHASFLALKATAQERRDVPRPGEPHDPADSERCDGFADPKMYAPMNEKEILEANERLKQKLGLKNLEKEGVFLPIPGYGIIAAKALSILEYDMFVKFKVSGNKVRLVIHSSEGMSNIAVLSPSTGRSRCEEWASGAQSPDNANLARIHLYYDSVMIQQYTVERRKDNSKAGQWVPTAPLEVPQGAAHLHVNRVSLYLGVDATISYNPKSRKWEIDEQNEQKGIHVCVPEVQLPDLSGFWQFFVRKATQSGWFQFATGELRPAKILQDTIYCAFKYSIPSALQPLMDFMANNHHQSEAGPTPTQIHLLPGDHIEEVDQNGRVVKAIFDPDSQLSIGDRITSINGERCVAEQVRARVSRLAQAQDRIATVTVVRSAPRVSFAFRQKMELSAHDLDRISHRKFKFSDSRIDAFHNEIAVMTQVKLPTVPLFNYLVATRESLSPEVKKTHQEYASAAKEAIRSKLGGKDQVWTDAATSLLDYLHEEYTRSNEITPVVKLAVNLASEILFSPRNKFNGKLKGGVSIKSGESEGAEGSVSMIEAAGALRRHRRHNSKVSTKHAIQKHRRRRRRKQQLQLQQQRQQEASATRTTMSSGGSTLLHVGHGRRSGLHLLNLGNKQNSARMKKWGSKSKRRSTKKGATDSSDVLKPHDNDDLDAGRRQAQLLNVEPLGDWEHLGDGEYEPVFNIEHSRLKLELDQLWLRAEAKQGTAIEGNDLLRVLEGVQEPHEAWFGKGMAVKLNNAKAFEPPKHSGPGDQAGGQEQSSQPVGEASRPIFPQRAKNTCIGSSCRTRHGEDGEHNSAGDHLEPDDDLSDIDEDDTSHSSPKVGGGLPGGDAERRAERRGFKVSGPLTLFDIGSDVRAREEVLNHHAGAAVADNGANSPAKMAEDKCELDMNLLQFYPATGRETQKYIAQVSNLFRGAEEPGRWLTDWLEYVTTQPFDFYAGTEITDQDLVHEPERLKGKIIKETSMNSHEIRFGGIVRVSTLLTFSYWTELLTQVRGIVTKRASTIKAELDHFRSCTTEFQGEYDQQMKKVKDAALYVSINDLSTADNDVAQASTEDESAVGNDLTRSSTEHESAVGNDLARSSTLFHSAEWIDEEGLQARRRGADQKEWDNMLEEWKAETTKRLEEVTQMKTLALSKPMQDSSPSLSAFGVGKSGHDKWAPPAPSKPRNKRWGRPSGKSRPDWRVSDEIYDMGDQHLDPDSSLAKAHYANYDRATRIHMPEDGSCGYHAVCHGLTLLGDMPSCTDIRDNEQVTQCSHGGFHLRDIVAAAPDLDPAQSSGHPAAHESGMQTLNRARRNAADGAFAEDKELELLAEHFRVCIIVYKINDPNDPHWNRWTELHSQACTTPETSERRIYLLNIANWHYDLLTNLHPVGAAPELEQGREPEAAREGEPSVK